VFFCASWQGSPGFGAIKDVRGTPGEKPSTIKQLCLLVCGFTWKFREISKERAVNTEFNPYSAPESAVADIDHRPAELASKGQRFGTLIIDYICFIALSSLFGIVIALLFGQAGIQAIRRVPNFLMGTLMMLTFYCFFESIWSRTPGKFLLGTAVITATGEKPSFPQIIGRTLCRFIPFEAFSFLGEGEGWHDSISKTQVVRVRGR
jgi:uncharacterized RDD family membrane protein YckC